MGTKYLAYNLDMRIFVFLYLVLGEVVIAGIINILLVLIIIVILTIVVILIYKGQ